MTPGEAHFAAVEAMCKAHDPAGPTWSAAMADALAVVLAQPPAVLQGLGLPVAEAPPEYASDIEDELSCERGMVEEYRDALRDLCTLTSAYDLHETNCVKDHAKQLADAWERAHELIGSGS